MPGSDPTSSATEGVPATGPRPPLTPSAGTEAIGFFACDADLEDQLIRALGTDAVERVLAREGELESFRRFQNQPDQRGRDVHAQLRRFMGTRAGRKIRYGSLMVEALAPGQAPHALECVLAHARAGTA